MQERREGIGGWNDDIESKSRSIIERRLDNRTAPFLGLRMTGKIEWKRTRRREAQPIGKYSTADGLHGLQGVHGSEGGEVRKDVWR